MLIIPGSIRAARGEAHPEPKRWAPLAIMAAIGALIAFGPGAVVLAAVMGVF